MRKYSVEWSLLEWLGMILAIVLFALGMLGWAGIVHADHVAGAGKMVRIPLDATRHRADLTRSARLAWGLDAPVATFAAQIHQESAWRADARSQVGARGMAQFMPATERWISGVYPRELSEADSGNPTWALRALARYDRWIWERVPVAHHLNGNQMYEQAGTPALQGAAVAGAPCRRMAATLRSYNGGLGWVQREARSGRPCEAFRSAASCRENLDYPRRILGLYEPIYINAGWGNGSCA